MMDRHHTNLHWRHRKAAIFHGFCIAVTGSAVLILMLLLSQVSVLGLPWLDMQFIESFPSRFPEKAGIKSALVGTLWLVSLTAMFAIPRLPAGTATVSPGWITSARFSFFSSD